MAGQKKSLTGDLFKGLEIDVPNDIKELLIPGERMVHAVRQARLEQAITPDAIFVTTHRIIIRRPTAWGLKQNITDYRYEDMANTRIERGIINSSIYIDMRFLSEECCLRGIPNKTAARLFRTIQEQISRIASKASLSSSLSPSQYPSSASQKPQQLPQDPLTILQIRFAKGEITREEYLSMKQALEL